MAKKNRCCTVFFQIIIRKLHLCSSSQFRLFGSKKAVACSIFKRSFFQTELFDHFLIYIFYTIFRSRFSIFFYLICQFLGWQLWFHHFVTRGNIFLSIVILCWPEWVCLTSELWTGGIQRWGVVVDFRRKPASTHNNGHVVGFHENGALSTSAHAHWPQNGVDHGRYSGRDEVNRKYDMGRVPSADSGIGFLCYHKVTVMDGYH